MSEVELHSGEPESASRQCISRCSAISLHTLLERAHDMPDISPDDRNINVQFRNAEVVLHFMIKDEISGAFMATIKAYYSHLHCHCPYSTLNTIL